MNTRISIYLDILRVLAAMTVLLSHLSHISGDPWPVFTQFGHVAVIVFFALSGYVIGYVADARENAFEIFAVHRLARLYSVVLPALILTFVLHQIGPCISPDIYAEAMGMDHPMLRWIMHGLFLQEIWLLSVSFFGNGPLWSLGYEFFYYALFAVAVLYKGPFRRSIFIALALLAGPTIMIYGLIWLAGNKLYAAHKNDRCALNPARAMVIFVSSAAMAGAFIFWAPLLHTGFALHKKLDADQILPDFVFALCVLVNMWSAKYLPVDLTPLKKPATVLAGMSFSLYAFHYPLMQFFAALNAKYAGLTGTTELLALMVLILASVWGLSFISERQKKRYVAFFNAVIQKFKA